MNIPRTPVQHSFTRAVFQVGACATLSLLIAGCAAPKPEARPAAGQGVQLTQLADRIHVEINGQFFTEYFFKDVPRPYCHPILGPGGVAMTRDWPMKDVPGEDHDHPHHRSLWFAHGEVNGQDFWSEAKDFGKTRHDSFTQVQSGQDCGVVCESDKWVTAEGQVVATEERKLRFYNRPKNERVLDFEITLRPVGGDLTMGDTKEGAMAIRLAESMRLKPNKRNTGKPGGHIVNSEGVRDGNTWGKRAAWCDYYGPVGDKTVGVAIFDHPQNPRHPTWWHVRDYGLFAANPFGKHDFEKLADKTAGNLVIPLGQSATFRYRFYFHEGDEQQAKVAERYQEYVNTIAAKP